MEKSTADVLIAFIVALPATIAALSSLRNGWKLTQAKDKLDRTEAKIPSLVSSGVQNAIDRRSEPRSGEASW